MGRNTPSKPNPPRGLPPFDDTPMDSFATTVLFLTAIALPAVLFLLFRPRSRLKRACAAIIAIALGWSFNVACVVATQSIAGPSKIDGDILDIAIAYGWACPSVLVLLTWLAWHLATRRKTV